ncbi:hypothetical protein AJ78_03151 [Emergomyces pasteurianus Ep9510]|uniref:Amine oxidase domain-containing protein n=1 Tax=Emergomyces pasteurianus Ep9510 TaxID=1447872 RepID=A0A1J9QNA2_9EURO|nr:hypothetical protein AJ78_03151 [Emergomyces pasteurianus Ep9510]
MASPSQSANRQKVLIIGAGAAGMSCAATLAEHPNKFDITIIERAGTPGGVATSLPLDRHIYGADWMNNGVQGGPGLFRHTFKYLRDYGFDPKEMKLQFSFGKDKENFWTNVFPTALVEKHADEIKKFGKALEIIRKGGIVLWILPVKSFLRLFCFSKEFRYKMVIPLASIVLGTGNQTEEVPCGLLQQLFYDPEMKVWDYDPVSFVPNLPSMFTFPNMQLFYRDWAIGLCSKGVTIRLTTEVTKIVRRDRQGIAVETARVNGGTQSGDSMRGNTTLIEGFDKLVLCIPGDEANHLLGKRATWKERFALGGIKMFNRLTITHSDSAYIRELYETRFREELCAKPQTKEQEDQISFAKGATGQQSGFRPMYYSRAYHEMKSKMEPGFDCSNFQYQFQPDVTSGQAALPFDHHVFQSHFLDDKLKHLWTANQIDERSIIERRWWHQLSHRWQHYIRVAPAMRFINGNKNTYFAGSWTFVDIHEVACISGIAAAYRLGAKYDAFDDLAAANFAKYLKNAHGIKFEA